ncbi:MAG: nucleoside deaminase [Bacteroidota bacterium]
MQPQSTSKAFLLEAIELSRRNIRDGKGGPFGAVIVRGNSVVAQGTNLVTSTHDPTAHAEIVAIREACRSLGTFQLDDCEIYTSCEPCPMCLGAIYWARLRRLIFANTRKDAMRIGFDDEFLYREITLPHIDRRIPTVHIESTEALSVFTEWEQMEDKIRY